MGKLKLYWQATNNMPFILRILCRGGMLVGPIGAIFTLLPIQEWRVNGAVMSYSQLWLSGTAPSMLALFFLIGLGMWRLSARQPQARWALIASVIVPSLIHFVFSQDLSEVGLNLANAAITGALIYGYFFHSSAVKSYLNAGA